MTKGRRDAMLRFFAGLLLFSVAACPEAFAVNCDGKIVSEGDDKAAVLLKCGEPVSREERQETIVTRDEDGTKREQTATIEDWTYNFGPDRLIQILTFRNGILRYIRSGGYGHREEAAPGEMCGGRILSLGQTKAEVLLACGEPFDRTRWSETVTERIDEKTKREKTIQIEEWTYQFGPNRFMRVMRFRDNRLVEIRLGGYGR